MANLGGAVKLKGESEYRKALRDINQNLKEVGSQLKLTASEFDKNDTSIKAVKAQKDVLNKKMEEEKQKVSTLKKEYDLMSKEYEKNENKHNELVQSYEKEKSKLEQIKATLGTTSSEYQKQEKNVDSLAKAVKQSETSQEANKKSLSNLRIEMNKAQREINKTAKEFENVGKKAKEGGEGFTIFKGVVANLGAQAISGAINGLAKLGSMVLDVGKQALESYGEYEQLVGGVETLFKDSAGTVENYANNAYKTAGLSANEYMETVTSFSASLLQSLGGNTEEAAKFADLAITDMSDNANKMGTDMSSIQNAYQGFAKQNYTMLDNLKLGYGGTKTEMERLISDANELAKAQGQAGDLTIESYADVVEAIHLVQENMGIAGTTAKEASTTIQGSVNSMKSAWENLLTGMADGNSDIGELINNLVTSIVGEDGEGGVLNNILPVIEQIITSLPETIGTLITELLPQLLEISSNLISSLAQGLIDNLPTMIQSATELLLNFIEYFLDNIDLVIDLALDIIMALADGLIQALPTLIEKAPIIIQKLIDAIVRNYPKIVKTAGELIGKLAVGIIGNLYKLAETAPQIISTLVNGLSALGSTIMNAGRNLVEGIWQGITGASGWLFGKVREFAQNILQNIKDSLGIHSPSTLFRDQVGKNLALGLGEGFSDEMRAVTSEMQNAIPTDFDVNGKININESNNRLTTIDIFNTFIKALEEVKIELDDEETGKFVRKTVNKLVYS